MRARITARCQRRRSKGRERNYIEYRKDEKRLRVWRVHEIEALTVHFRKEGADGHDRHEREADQAKLHVKQRVAGSDESDLRRQ